MITRRWKAGDKGQEKDRTTRRRIKDDKKTRKWETEDSGSPGWKSFNVSTVICYAMSMFNMFHSWYFHNHVFQFISRSRYVFSITKQQKMLIIDQHSEWWCPLGSSKLRMTTQVNVSFHRQKAISGISIYHVIRIARGKHSIPSLCEPWMGGKAGSLHNISITARVSGAPFIARKGDRTNVVYQTWSSSIRLDKDFPCHRIAWEISSGIIAGRVILSIIRKHCCFATSKTTVDLKTKKA